MWHLLDVKLARRNALHKRTEIINLWIDNNLCTNSENSDVLLHHSAYQTDIYQCKKRIIGLKVLSDLYELHIHHNCAKEIWHYSNHTFSRASHKYFLAR